MTSRRRLATAALALGAALVAAQFVPVDRSNPPAGTGVAAPPEVAALLERACFDCHSHRTEWPWYGYVAPLSWVVAHHVDEGRGDLNFDAWPVFDLELRELYLRDIEQQLLKGEMPPGYYKLTHPGARLDDDEVATLLAWSRDR